MKEESLTKCFTYLIRLGMPNAIDGIDVTVQVLSKYALP